VVHRALYAVTGGRFGLRPATADRYGMMRVTTTGRRSGQERSVMLGFLEDGPDLVTLAMNGWAEGAPAWWLNLQAHPDAIVDLPDGRRAVRARIASKDEQPRLWARMKALEADLDGYAVMRSRETPVVILEPRREA
jgi:deazaflavin-dependent oxidoreductase (nitroreductase family)